MPLVFPNLTEAKCRILTVCGHLQTEDSELLAWMAEKSARSPWPEYLCETSSGKYYVRLGIGGRKDGRHVHIDVAVPEHFRTPPSVEKSCEELMADLERFRGMTLDSDISCRFVEKMASVPLIRDLAGKRPDTTVKSWVRATSGTFTMGGGRVESLEWKLLDRDGDELVRIDLDLVQQPVVFDDAYLTNALGPASVFFQGLIKGTP